MTLIINIFKLNCDKKIKKINFKINIDNKIDPIDPEIVFFGLILVNLGPLKKFPKTYPPISEAIQHNNSENIITFELKELDKTKKIIQNKNKYNTNKILNVNL